MHLFRCDGVRPNWDDILNIEGHCTVVQILNFSAYSGLKFETCYLKLVGMHVHKIENNKC